LRKFSDNVLTFQVSKESIQRSIISKYKKGSEVNLELPLTMEKFLSGHLVQGHVDTVTSVLKVNEISEDLWNYEFKNNDYKYLVDKGSVTVNGISLTVVNPTDEHFTVAVIRETYDRTNFKNLNVDSIVNIEFDIMAKYVERFLNDK
jgi:riboflavin synthase